MRTFYGGKRATYDIQGGSFLLFTMMQRRLANNKKLLLVGRRDEAGVHWPRWLFMRDPPHHHLTDWRLDREILQ